MMWSGRVAMRNVVWLALVGIACGAETPVCDSASVYRCVGGVVFVYGCQAGSTVQCSKGCAVEGMTAGLFICPAILCRENVPKQEGDPCEGEDDCLPTSANWSSTMVTNAHLTCDAASHACVAAAGPTIADWLKPCSADVVARTGAMLGPSSFYGTPDTGCAEGWCARAPARATTSARADRPASARTLRAANPTPWVTADRADQLVSASRVRE